MSLIPRTDSTAKAEWHLTYSCNLECYACSRGSFLREAIVPPMTLEDAREFWRQADALDWLPNVIIIGGEPTLHPDFLGFVQIAMHRVRQRPGRYVQVYSNGNGERVRAQLDAAREMGASICPDAHKPAGSILPVSERGPDGSGWDRTPSNERWDPYPFVSPVDAGVSERQECYIHGARICGISVDNEGYSPCSMGGAMGALLGVGKTKRLADLFDPELVRVLTANLCRHCGYAYEGRKRVGKDDMLGVKPDGAPQTEDERRASDERRAEEVAFYRYGEAQARKWNTPMSPTWEAAFRGRR